MVLRSTIIVFWKHESLLYNPVGNCLFLSVPNQRQASICWISVSQGRNQQKHATGCAQLDVWFFFFFLLGLIFDLEDGGNMFLQNVNCLLPDYTALHPKRQNSSLIPLWEARILTWKNFLSIKVFPWLVYPFLATQIYFDNFGYLPKEVLNRRGSIITPYINQTFPIAAYSNVSIRSYVQVLNSEFLLVMQ
jgi:hypothetical protein